MKQNKFMLVVGFIVLLSMMMAACQPIVTTVEVKVIQTVESTKLVETTKLVESTKLVEATKIVEMERKPFTTPHPILGDLKVRQALSYCTNKADLIKSVYPLLTPAEQAKLVMNTFIPSGHWAYAGDKNVVIYPFSKDEGMKLLDAAGWTLAKDAAIRTNKAGDPLSLKFSTTTAVFRQTWAAVFEKQMKDCGVEIIRFHVPSSWWFGESTGLQRRDFELGAYAWVGQADPSGQTLWACDMTPLPSNNWAGQNYMGWCNDKATVAIKAANNTLLQSDRKAQYLIVQNEYTQDVPAIPLFNRTNVYAYNPKLTGFKMAPGQDYWDYNIEEWAIPGKDTLVLGLSQEPSSMYSLANSALVQRLAYMPVGSIAYKGLNYTYTKHNYVKDLPTLENKLAVNSDVDVKEGDKVMDADGNPADLKAGLKVMDNTGKVVDYKSGVKMKQLAVTFQFIDGIKWSDGEKLKKEDMELAYKHDCDKESGAVSYITCDQILKVDFKSDTEYTITFRPGVQPPTYMTYTLGWYPAHRKITGGTYDGKLLKDVPAKDWATLKEIAENPMDTGPYVLKEWKKGQSMTYEANPNWVGGKPATAKLVIKFIEPANAEAQLIAGEVDFLGDETLTAKTETLAKAEKDGRVKVDILASATWEHIDFNLFIK